MSNDERAEIQAGISIAFFGRRCPFTAIPFARLLQAGIQISSLILSSPSPIGGAVRLRRYRPSINLGDTVDSVERLAGEAGVPLYDIRRPLGDELETVLRQQPPDLLVASCFPWHIPEAIRQSARFGGINLHPSHLPRFRGPDPLFWAYRCGEHDWGVTVHQLADSFDAGATLAQMGFTIPDEMPGDQLERLAAQLGADLLLEVVAGASAGTLQGSVQDETLASYQTWPATDELRVERNWSVQRVLNFVIGVGPLGYDATIATTRGTRGIRSARATTQNKHVGELWLDEKTVCVTFADGTVELTVS